MTALQLDTSALLGLAYACVLAAVPLWAWSRTRSLTRWLVWAAAALLAGYLVAQFGLKQRHMFITMGDFLIGCALGSLLSTALWRRESAAFIGPVVAALAALTQPVLWPPAGTAPHAAQTTGLYVVQAALHAVGVGAVLAAMPSWYARSAESNAENPRELASLVVLGAGLALSSAWAWLNWGLVWHSGPRLNLLVGGWLLLMAGHHAERAAKRQLAAIWRTIGVAILLLAVLGAGLWAGWWGHLPLLAW